jgi:hypothetical protein
MLVPDFTKTALTVTFLEGQKRAIFCNVHRVLEHENTPPLLLLKSLIPPDPSDDSCIFLRGLEDEI